TDIGPDAVESLNHAIESTLPPDAAAVLTNTLNATTGQHRGASVAAVAAGILVALWSASAGMSALQAGLDVVYHVPTDKPFLRPRGRALVLRLAMIGLGGVATALIVFGQPIGAAVNDHLPFGGAVFTAVWSVARYAIGMVALATLFAALYYLGP